jgi:hypothetical protein
MRTLIAQLIVAALFAPFVLLAIVALLSLN